MSDRFDLLVLGSGSTAFAAALRAADLGRRVLLTESRTVGGTCVARGCLPSKNLIEAARLVHQAAHPRFPGLRPARLEVDFAALVAAKDALVEEQRQKKYQALVAGTIEVARGHARLAGPTTLEVDGQRHEGSAILVATGSRPVVPPIPGLDEVPYLTSDLLTSGESMALAELPRSLVVVGGGYVALELGQLFARLGTEVTIVERGPALLARGFEPEVGATVAEALAAEGIGVRTEARVERVRSRPAGVAVDLGRPTGPETITADRLLIATGRRPNSDGIGAEATGVALGPAGEIVVDPHLRTSVPSIYAAGDVIGGQQGSQMATPVGAVDGALAAENALGERPPRSVDHRVVPRAVFCDPPVASVGLTETEVRAAGRPCWVGMLPLALVPRAGVTLEPRGFVKMVADAGTNEVLGVTLVGRGAPEVIHEAAMALRFRARLEDYLELIHVYPTMAEALKLVALSRFRDPATRSCCAT